MASNKICNITNIYSDSQYLPHLVVNYNFIEHRKFGSKRGGFSTRILWIIFACFQKPVYLSSLLFMNSCLSEKIDQLVGSEIGLTCDEVNNRKQSTTLSNYFSELLKELLIIFGTLLIFFYYLRKNRHIHIIIFYRKIK